MLITLFLFLFVQDRHPPQLSRISISTFEDKIVIYSDDGIESLEIKNLSAGCDYHYAIKDSKTILIFLFERDVPHLDLMIDTRKTKKIRYLTPNPFFFSF